MKLFIALSCYFISAVCAGGPEAVEEKWEACNSKQDTGLASLSNSLNGSEHFVLKGSDPCTKCLVWNLGTVQRTTDTHFEKAVDGGFKHTMKLGFTQLRILCSCSKDTGVKKLDGQMQAIWTEPRFTIELMVNKPKNTAAFTGSKVDSIMAKTCAQECVGDSDWKGQCEQMKKAELFDATIKNTIENLFPAQSTETVQNSKEMTNMFYCGE